MPGSGIMAVVPGRRPAALRVPGRPTDGPSANTEYEDED
ncbi:hypothetical protein SLNWT_4239 [Streptomyces albus]|uniref:Uncharacterized protein n=1 Tax=Streptomyces albus (strain ATCC 21838 / DSM 41398 / FERM P-419 / JCM 4703 / NBRC 107858) TaxID=1081613 RepID=A0A0B5EZ01_STRA4|nr:hypothetical protein SLNWT_4239 [Streptomyces albus]AOU78924.1 hypothetical protein SLNHY_4233 [Streptomyces albus]AYN34659.1 hypothetical protein DUI70_4160 [Streptomyces albus]